ncbi:MAG TPA: peptidylprolyl isomerase, partial [Ohtaekwangia sp.]|uniref:peptidylprolyl isomerase n=1 Tax=Ohtaekwangia sp. TaxID=2066019 RepID=UPI002F92F544
EIKIDPAKYNQALQQFFSNPANQPAYDTIARLYQAGNSKEAQDFIMKLKPRVEKQTGIKAEREVSPEKLKIYTTIGGAPQLDGEYTVFGKVIKGLEVIDKIAALPKDQSDRPIEDIRMTVTVEELSKKKIEKLYGYHYPPKVNTKTNSK